ncbi:MAG: endonuclease/exonuclease/phosphatase family protein [Planctomycetota bacterium]
MRRRTLWLSLSILLPVLASGLLAAEPDKALPEVSWDKAAEHIGEECVVVGQVVLTKNIGTMCFLNFHADFRAHFTAVVKQESFDRFPEPPETLYAGKLVKITGTIIEYQGKPEIIVTGPEQVRIVDEAEIGRVPVTTTVPASQPARTPTVEKTGATPHPPPATSRPFEGTVTIASYNVLNLFDDYDEPYHADEGTPPKPSEELARLADTIHKVNADVLALQEVENRGYVEQFNRTLLADLGYENVVLFEGNDERGIDVAVLSRLPVGPVTSYRHTAYKNPDGQAARFRRDLLHVRIGPPGAQSFDVFVMHFKSKGDGEGANTVRMGEAAAARAILDQVLREDPEACFVLCGDFNDTFDSAPVRALVGSGPTAMQCFFADIPEDQRITFNKEPYRSMIDFMFCSPAMARRYEPQSYRVYAGTVESSGSDHNPISARFKLR